MKKDDPGRAESGQSLIEFAFSLVLLLILIAGVVDGGRALFVYMALRDAAQEGALYGSANGAVSDSLVKAQIVERTCKSSSYLSNESCGDAVLSPGAHIKVEVSTIGPPCAGNGLKVRVSYDQFPLAMPFIGTIVGSQAIGISTSIVNTIISPFRCS